MAATMTRSFMTRRGAEKLIFPVCLQRRDWPKAPPRSSSRCFAANESFGGRLLCLGDDGIERGLWQIVAVEQKRLTVGAPRNGVVHAPEGDHLHRVTVFHECAENPGISGG